MRNHKEQTTCEYKTLGGFYCSLFENKTEYYKFNKFSYKKNKKNNIIFLLLLEHEKFIAF